MLGYLSDVPVTWEQTIPLLGKIGQYAVMAKRTGDTWYVGAINNWDKRDLTVDFSFLPEGVEYDVEAFVDVEDCATDASLYEHTCFTANSTTKKTIPVASGGGFALVLKTK